MDLTSLDPRLQSSESTQSKSSNNNIDTSHHVADSSHHTSTPNSAGTGQNPQQHQYYGVPTPNSYSSDQNAPSQTFPYDSSVVGPYSNGMPLPTAAEVAADLKRSRACEACRQLKVKCEPDDSVAGTCRRCYRSGRQCVVTAPTRKRQKKTDSRVAELEKKIDALTASLHAQKGDESSGHGASIDFARTELAALLEQRSSSLYGDGAAGQWNQTSAASDKQYDKESESSPPSAQRAMPGNKRTHDDFIESSVSNAANSSTTKAMPGDLPIPSFPSAFSLPNTSNKPATDTDFVDVIDRKFIDIKSAYQCFDHYVYDMAPCLPFVVFPPGTRAEDIRRSKPILFLAILSVASGYLRPDVHTALITEAVRVYADRCMCRGEKSMELVQALLVTTIWYAPPERYEELNFNQLIHVAAVMAIDIGMGKRMKSGHIGLYKEYVDKKAFTRIPDPDAAETRRTWLGCYFMCAKWTGYMDDSLELLDGSSDALPSDRWLTCLIRGQHIAEEVGFQFSMDDPTVEISVTDPKTQYHLKAFERQLAEWRSRTPKDLQNGEWSGSRSSDPFTNESKALFAHSSNIISLYVHEIAMHHNHNIDDFKPPYSVQPESNSPDPDVITPGHIESLTTCIQSIHGAFDAIVAMDVMQLRSMPTLSFVRTSYAAVALIKLSSSITAPNQRYGEVFKPEDLKADYYLDTIIKQLRNAAEGDKCRVAGKFSFIFGMLRTWYQKRLEPDPQVHGSVKSVLGQPTIQQSPSSAQWPSTSLPKPITESPRQSGLQMLSEVASSSNNKQTTMPMATIPQVPTPAAAYPPQNLNMYPYAADLGGGMMSGVDIDMMGFDTEDWNALSGMMNDPQWLSVSMDNSGQMTGMF